MKYIVINNRDGGIIKVCASLSQARRVIKHLSSLYNTTYKIEVTADLWAGF